MYKIYGFNRCNSCRKAVELAKQKNLPYEFIVINTDEIREDVKYLAGVKGNLTIPQIFKDDVYIGGLKEYINYISRVRF